MRLIVADVRSTSTDGIAAGHYFTVAQNYLDLFGAEMDVRIAGGPVYGDRFGDKLIRLPHDYIAGSSAVRNKRAVFQNVRALLREAQDDVIVLQCSAVATAYLGLALFKKKETRVYAIQYSTDGVNSVLKRGLYALCRRKISGVICPNAAIGAAYGRPMCVVSDYISTGTMQPPVPYAQKRYDFGMVGLITSDKGVVEAAKQLRNTPYRVLIAGRVQEALLEAELRAVCAGAKNIELRLEYLSEAAYDEAIRQCRYCILNYSENYSLHSSGVVFDILFRGVPIVGSRCGTLQMVEANELGKTVSSMADFAPERLLDEAVHDRYVHNIARYCQSQAQEREKLRDFLTRGAAE